VKRFAALVVAVGMVLGATALRGRLDQGAQDRTTTGDLRLVCSSHIRPVCDALAADGFDVLVEDAGTTADRLASLAEGADTGFTAWLTDSAWPGIVSDNRRFAGTGGETLGDSSAVLGLSRTGVAVLAAAEEALEQACGGGITWRCIGDRAATTRVGLASPDRADGLVVLASAVGGYLGSPTYSTNDLEDDPEFDPWFEQLTRLSRRTPLGRQTPLERALAAAGTFTVVGSTEAEMQARLEGRNDFRPLYPEPAALAAVVLSVPVGGDADEELDVLGRDRLTAALQEAGWRTTIGVADAATLPAPGVLQQLRDRW
jgi:hypothetical protein